VLVYGLNYAPELTGIGKYSGEMVGQLVADGYEVQVITAPPYYPDWQVFAGHSNWWSSLDVKSNGSLHVIRCPLWVPSKPTGLKRILHLLSFALSSLPIVIAKAFWRLARGSALWREGCAAHSRFRGRCSLFTRTT
jgi:colanic acid biosynthesis glycosyl transferase WcaI